MIETSPHAVFQQQIAYVRADDREAQLRLYAENCVYEFPFATDRPRRMVGVDAFRAAMTPLWARSRAASVRIVGHRGEAHGAADDPELVFAEFTFVLDIAGRCAEADFVQVVRVQGGRIVALREYAGPGPRPRTDEA